MSIDLRIMNVSTKAVKGLAVRIQMWNGKRSQSCAVKTFKSLINNMFIGVTEVSSTLCCYAMVMCSVFKFPSN